MEIRRLRALAVEIFKTLNEINPPYMKNTFTPKERKTELGYYHKKVNVRSTAQVAE